MATLSQAEKDIKAKRSEKIDAPKKKASKKKASKKVKSDG